MVQYFTSEGLKKIRDELEYRKTNSHILLDGLEGGARGLYYTAKIKGFDMAINIGFAEF